MFHDTCTHVHCSSQIAISWIFFQIKNCFVSKVQMLNDDPVQFIVVVTVHALMFVSINEKIIL